MIFTILTIDIQILGSPDYCMGPNEERSLTVVKKTSSELSKRVVEPEPSESSSVIKRSHSRAFALPSSSMEEIEARRIRHAIRRGTALPDLPDGNIEDINHTFKPTINMPFDRVPGEIPPTVSNVAPDACTF